jgi:hypothetical protein
MIVLSGTRVLHWLRWTRALRWLLTRAELRRPATGGAQGPPLRVSTRTLLRLLLLLPLPALLLPLLLDLLSLRQCWELLLLFWLLLLLHYGLYCPASSPPTTAAPVPAAPPASCP